MFNFDYFNLFGYYQNEMCVYIEIVEIEQQQWKDRILFSFNRPEQILGAMRLLLTFVAESYHIIFICYQFDDDSLMTFFYMDSDSEYYSVKKKKKWESIIFLNNQKSKNITIETRLNRSRSNFVLLLLFVCFSTQESRIKNQNFK